MRRRVQAFRIARTLLPTVKVFSFIAFAIALSTWPSAARAESGLISVSDAVAIAKSHNPDLDAAAQELTIALGQSRRADYLTPFNLEQDNLANYRTRQDRSNSQDWQVGLLQEIEIFGQRGLRQQSAALNMSETQARVRDRMRLIVGAVKLSFYDAMRARERVELLRELEALDSRLLDAARKRLNAGEIGQIEYNVAVVRHGQSSRALIDGMEAYRFQRSSLGRLLGGFAGPEPAPEGALDAPTLAFDLDTMVTQAQHNRPDLRARELEIARLNAESSLNQRMNWPNPVVGPFVGHDNNTNNFYGAQLGFSVPLFNHRTGEATELEGQRRKAQAELRGGVLDVEREVRDAYNQYQSAYKALKVYEDDIVAPARENFRLIERAFREGKIDLLRLSIAERDAFEAQTSYLDAWFDVRAAEIAIEMATGVSS